MRMFFLAFLGFVLSGVFLLPLVNEQLTPPDAYLIYGPLALMAITLMLQIDAAFTYKKLMIAHKLELENDSLRAELKETTAKFHIEKKATTDLRSQIAQVEKAQQTTLRRERETWQSERERLLSERERLVGERERLVAERDSLQCAFDESVKSHKALSETLSQQAAQAESAGGAEKEVVHLLSLLQEKGRLVDFLMDDITKYPDAQVGAAARVVHRGCAQVLGDYFAIAPVSGASEGSQVSVAGDGYDPKEYRFIGKVGEPPFTGTLLHRGWCTTKVDLPHLVDDEISAHLAGGAQVITPAEIEVS